jgi:hypothetical protein
MAMKRILTKAEFAKLSDIMKAEYKADDTGENFTLDLTDFEDPGALKRAKDHEKENRKEVEKQLKIATDKLAALEEEREGMLKGSVPKGDVEKLEKSYKEKLTKRESELLGEMNGLRTNLNTMLVDNVANQLAAEISTAPKLMLPHIKARLSPEYSEGKASTRILDNEGKPSAMTLDDLRKEFLANNDFSSILVGTKASGSGAAGAGGGRAPVKKLSDFKTATEEAQFANEYPQEYQRLVKS